MARGDEHSDGEFGFKVERVREELDYDDDKGYSMLGEVIGYRVSLPHQCDEWIITRVGPFERDAAVKEEAVKMMELFVREAQQALEKLKGLD